MKRKEKRECKKLVVIKMYKILRRKKKEDK